MCIINTAQTLYMPRKTSSSSSKIKIIKLKFQLLYFRGNKDYSSSSAKLTLCFKNNRHSAESLSSIINHIQDIMTNHLIYSEIRKHDPYSRQKKKPMETNWEITWILKLAEMSFKATITMLKEVEVICS